MCSLDGISTREYEYRALPDGLHVRYLCLEPGEGRSPIQCSLHTGHLDNMPYFEAISYVWGSSERSIVILCDGAALYITKNLRDVLYQVRDPFQARTIWADSICINQQDDSEKSNQVSMMGHLYSRADRVLICLGLDNDATATSEQVASLIADVDRMIKNELANIYGTWNSFPFPDDEDPIFEDERWAALREMLDEPWFERGWTVQEAGLATDARILWGKAELDWRALLRLHWWIALRAPQLSGRWHLFGLQHLHMKRYQVQYKREAMTMTTSIDERCNFLQYLDIARTLKLSDPRDRVYAFLGLRDDDSAYRPSITPNYQKTVEEVYRELAADYLDHSKNNSILHFVEHNESTIGHGKLASWIPNWATSSYHSSLPVLRTPLVKNPSMIASQPRMDDEGNLQVRAAIFDTVRYASGKLRWGSTAISEVVSIWTEISGMSGHTPYSSMANSAVPLEVFATVLAAGHFNSSKMQCHMFAYMLRLHEGTTPGTSAYCTPEQLSIIKTKSDGGNVIFYQDHVRGLGHNRRVVMTQRGFYGLAPGIVREGDQCALVFGGSEAPFILRETETSGYYKVLGDSYMLGPSKGMKTGTAVVLGIEETLDWVGWGIKDRKIVLC